MFYTIHILTRELNMASIDNTENIIDSRDIIDRIEELKDCTDHSDAVELNILQNLADQCEGYGDWAYGEAVIRDSFFTEYTQQTVEDCYDVSQIKVDDCPWNVPGAITINWEVIAESAKQDYTEVDFDGVTYWIRS